MAKAGDRSGGGAAPGPSHERLLGALGELVRACDTADRRAGGALLGERGEAERQALLVGLMTTLMRFVVVACAEARALVPGDEASSLAALHVDLAARAQRGEALEASSGAWGRALEATSRVFDGRALPFLQDALPDEVLRRALDSVFVGEDGARVRYEELGVEHLGGAYEGLVGFELRAARGDTMLALPNHAAVDLEALLAVRATARSARVAEMAGGVAGTRLGAALARAETTEALARALSRRASPRWPGVVPGGSLYLVAGQARRRAGAHYTPPALTTPVVTRALGPLLSGRDAERLLALRICDPAMGAGAFLVEACRQLAERLVEVDPTLDAPTARRLVAERCLHGVDQDPLAVELARAALWLVVGDRRAPLSFLEAHLRCGDALVGMGLGGEPGPADAEATGRTPFHWPEEIPEVLGAGRPGFDAFVGNPPWVAYAGRAAQPLPGALFAYYLRHYPSFHGYRTLHGLFIYRCASLLAPGGRLGLVVPTSVSDLGGYEPARRAHDALCAVDEELPDFGDAFEGVFQPSMGLLSTRRAGGAAAAGAGAPWRVARDDLDPTAAALLARLSALPPLPASCFGERGLQTTGDDAAQFASVATPRPPFVVPLREGGDVRAFRALPPRLHVDPTRLTGKLRADAVFREVRVLVRQTARFPIAAHGDGAAFRNSILAGFAVAPYGEDALVAYLNSAPIRWLHFMRFRDARQGMPQVKIGHLRSIPRVPGDAPAWLAALSTLGAALGRRNEGISGEEQRRLDEATADALDLSGDERALVAAWAARHPAP